MDCDDRDAGIGMWEEKGEKTVGDDGGGARTRYAREKVRERRSRTLTKLRKDKTAREFSLPLSDRFSLSLSLYILL